MIKKQQLIIGKLYNGYGKYLGITKVYNYDGKIINEYRFQTDKKVHGVSVINSINTKDKITIGKILLKNMEY